MAAVVDSAACIASNAAQPTISLQIHGDLAKHPIAAAAICYGRSEWLVVSNYEPLGFRGHDSAAMSGCSHAKGTTSCQRQSGEHGRSEAHIRCCAVGEGPRTRHFRWGGCQTTSAHQG